MGTETLATIRNSIRTRGDYPYSPKFDDPFVNKCAQAGWASLYELVSDTWEGWYDKKDETLVTVAGQEFIALPADCWRVQAVDISDGTRWQELRQIGVGDRNRFAPTSGTPIAHRLSSRGIELTPPPDAVYQLRALYIPKVVPLAENTAVEFFNNWDEYVIQFGIMLCHERAERAIDECYRLLFDPENGLKVKITKAATKRRAQEPEYLQLREHYDLDEWGLF